MLAPVLSGRTTVQGALFGPGRSRRSGPEADLVDEFVSGFKPQLPGGCEFVVLHEPQVESLGFPDLVVLIWDTAVATRWREERRLIDRLDLRLAHLIFTLGGASRERLNALVKRGLGDRLERLEAAELVQRRRDRWTTTDLAQAFAVRSILSFEAKMSLTSRVLDQAAGNRWFASTSYVLVPAQPHRAGYEEARRSGVGVWVRGKARALVAQRSARQPRSYVSWLFNDWAWRASGSALA